MRRGDLIGSVLLVLLAASPPGAIAEDPAQVHRFEVAPREPPAQPGESIPVRAVLEPSAAVEQATLHLTIAGPSGVEEIETSPRPVGSTLALLVTFWEPSDAGRHVVTGHVHAAGDTVELPTREQHVQAAPQDPAPVDGSSWGIGIAPGTVLWALAFMGLAYASQRRKKDGG